jgi:hypothetical protein
LPLIFFRERQGQGTLFLPLKKVKHQQCSLPLKKVGATGGQGQDYCTVRGKEKKDEKSTFFLPLLPLGTKLFSKTLPLRKLKHVMLAGEEGHRGTVLPMCPWSQSGKTGLCKFRI